MKIKPGIKLLDEVEGQGISVSLGDVVQCRYKYYYNKGEKILFNKPQSVISTCAIDDNGDILECTSRYSDIEKYHEIQTKCRVHRTDLMAGIYYSIIGMKLGGYRKLKIAPHLMFGDKGYTDVVKPNSVIVVEIWLDDVCS